MKTVTSKARVLKLTPQPTRSREQRTSAFAVAPGSSFEADLVFLRQYRPAYVEVIEELCADAARDERNKQQDGKRQIAEARRVARVVAPRSPMEADFAELIARRPNGADFIHKTILHLLSSLDADENEDGGTL